MITEDFFPIHQVVQHSELLLKKTVKFVIEKWKEKGMPFYASITDVIDNSVLRVNFKIDSCISRVNKYTNLLAT